MRPHDHQETDIQRKDHHHDHQTNSAYLKLTTPPPNQLSKPKANTITTTTKKLSHLISSHLTESLALAGALVEEHLGADDVSEWRKRRGEVGVRQVVWQVVDEQVRARRT